VLPLAGVLGADVVQRPVPRHPRADLAATWVALGGDRGHIPSAGRVEPGKRSG